MNPIPDQPNVGRWNCKIFVIKKNESNRVNLRNLCTGNKIVIAL
jgi:hypothetical protein